jgi:hypothetical protein
MFFKAASKELAGPQRAYGPDLSFSRPDPLQIESIPSKMSARVIIDRPLQDLIGASSGGAVPYRFLDHQGSVIAKGTLDDNGATSRVFHNTHRDYTVLLGEPGDWHKIEHDDDGGVCGCGADDDGEHTHQHLEDGQDAGPDIVGDTADSAADDEEGAELGTGLSARDQAFELHLLDQLVFGDPDIQQIINDGED